MRMPVPRNRLVTLSILAALVTGAVTVGLADPSLLPGTDEVTLAGSPTDGGAGQLDLQTGPATASPDATGAATPEGDASASTGAQPAEQPPASAAATPTPNPNFTPAVQTAATGGGRGEYEEHEEEEEHEDDEWWEHDEDDEWDDD